MKLQRTKPRYFPSFRSTFSWRLYQLRHFGLFVPPFGLIICEEKTVPSVLGSGSDVLESWIMLLELTSHLVFCRLEIAILVSCIKSVVQEAPVSIVNTQASSHRHPRNAI
ncbi:hypothetical protein ACMFMG_007648 [Clarireedia jacksonii]